MTYSLGHYDTILPSTAALCQHVRNNHNLLKPCLITVYKVSEIFILPLA